MAAAASQLHSSFTGTFLGCAFELDEHENTHVVIALTHFFHQFEEQGVPPLAQFVDDLRGRLMSAAVDSEFVTGVYCFTEPEIAWIRAGIEILIATDLLASSKGIEPSLSKLANRLRSVQLRRLPDAHREDFL